MSGARSARVARILVIGANRGIGRVVTKQALERGYVVRALSCRRGRSAAPDLEYVAADALDPATIAAAMNDCQSSNDLGRLSGFWIGRCGSSRVDVKPRVFDGTSVVSGYCGF